MFTKGLSAEDQAKQLETRAIFEGLVNGHLDPLDLVEVNPAPRGAKGTWLLKQTIAGAKTVVAANPRKQPLIALANRLVKTHLDALRNSELDTEMLDEDYEPPSYSVEFIRELESNKVAQVYFVNTENRGGGRRILSWSPLSVLVADAVESKAVMLALNHRDKAWHMDESGHDSSVFRTEEPPSASLFGEDADDLGQGLGGIVYELFVTTDPKNINLV